MPRGFVSAAMTSAKKTIWIQPTRVMGSSELLRNEKRVDEVESQRERDDGAEPIFELHGVLLEAIAAAGVGDGQSDEPDGHSNEDEVRHGPRWGNMHATVTISIPSRKRQLSAARRCKVQCSVAAILQGARRRRGGACARPAKLASEPFARVPETRSFA